MSRLFLILFILSPILAIYGNIIAVHDPIVENKILAVENNLNLLISSTVSVILVVEYYSYTVKYRCLLAINSYCLQN